jgi:hypothetical protein
MMSFSIEVDKEAYENYFRMADSNGDGKINGPEAVAFFYGSNLPQEVLSQVSRSHLQFSYVLLFKLFDSFKV